MFKMFKKKPEELNVRQSCIFVGLISLLSVVPAVIILNFEEIKDWIGDKVAWIKSKLGKGGF